LASASRRLDRSTLALYEPYADSHRTPTATDTTIPTDTPTPTATDTTIPTDTPTPTATDTGIPTDTPTPTATDTGIPTDTPTPTETLPAGPRTFSGYVYEGDPGDHTNPLSDAIVTLYGSSDGSAYGYMLDEYTTSTNGYFQITTNTTYSYYNVMERNPFGMESTGAIPGTGGVKKDDDWIQYAGVPTGTYGGNEFYDKPMSKITDTPTATATWTRTPTATLTRTQTRTATPSRTPGPSRTQTPTPTASPTAEATATVSPTPSDTPTVTVTPTSTPILYGIIDGVVWQDANENAAWEWYEPGFGNVTVALYRDGEAGQARLSDDPSPYATATTKVNGFFEFTDVPYGRYHIEVTDMYGVLGEYERTTASGPAQVELSTGHGAVAVLFGYARVLGYLEYPLYLPSICNNASAASSASGVSYTPQTGGMQP